MLTQFQKLATNLETLALTETLKRRNFLKGLAAFGLGKTIFSAALSRSDESSNLGTLLDSGQQEPNWVRVLEDDEKYSLKLHSKWYQQGDLIVAELEPHVQLQDSSINFYATRPNGTVRKLSLPKLYKDGKIFVFFGVDHEYPAQNATLDVQLRYNSRNIGKSYTIEIKRLENIREEHLSSATTQNSEPRTPEDNLALERERNLLYPAWGDYTTKLDYITGGFHLPRPVCDFESFGSRRIYDGSERSRHNGLDCKGEIGDIIRATLPGEIAVSRDGFFFMGNAVLIKHGFGLYTLYAHMSERNVQEGEAVMAGQAIGRIGSTGRLTGPHLHWQAKLYGMNIDPKSLEILNDVFH